MGLPCRWPVELEERCRVKWVGCHDADSHRRWAKAKQTLPEEMGRHDSQLMIGVQAAKLDSGWCQDDMHPIDLQWDQRRDSGSTVARFLAYPFLPSFLIVGICRD